jgi:hypothetical protein
MAEPRDTVDQQPQNSLVIKPDPPGSGVGFLVVPDDVKLYFGSDGDAYISSDGSTVAMVGMSISADDLTLTGNLAFADAVEAVFGTGSDASIQFDGTDWLFAGAEAEFSDGVKLPDDTKLTLGDDDDASIEYDENGANVLQFLGARAQFEGGVKLIDDKTVVLGTDDDASMEYDEDGTNELRFAGAAAIFENHVKIDDDKALRFGRDADVLFSYDEAGVDLLLVTGKGVRFGGLRRQVVALSDNTSVTAAQCNFSIITQDTGSKTVTLPAIAADNLGADAIIAPVGNIATTVNITGGASFGGAGGGTDSLALAAGEAAHVVNDGTSWIVMTPGTLS